MNADELAHGIAGTSASWHEQYKNNAWVFAGGLAENLNEGDVLAVFSQYGEIEDLHLVRDPDSGKSKGFGFLKYEDERSTVLAVDNLNGYTLLGKTLRVDHTDYRPPQKKKSEIQAEEAKGVAHVMQTAGHAYVGKDLATNHSLDEGVDVFNTSVDPRPNAPLPSSTSSSSSSSSSSSPALSSMGEENLDLVLVDTRKRQRDDPSKDERQAKKSKKKEKEKEKKKLKKMKKQEKKERKKEKKAAKKKDKKLKKSKGKKKSSSTRSSTSSSESDA